MSPATEGEEEGEEEVTDGDTLTNLRASAPVGIPDTVEDATEDAAFSLSLMEVAKDGRPDTDKESAVKAEEIGRAHV